MTLVHKTNVLNYAGNLWQRVFDEVAATEPDVVTDNIFGDILTDLAGAIQGGMGVATGANISPGGISMFEPIGGTAPDHVCKGTINPLAAIGAAALMLAELGETAGAARIDTAIRRVAPRMASMRAGAMGFTTQQVGDMVAESAAHPREP